MSSFRGGDRNRNRRRYNQWDVINNEEESQPVVVNATLNLATNQFDVMDNPVQEQRPPSKFDFMRHGQDSQAMQWTMDMQQGHGWGAEPAQVESWSQPMDQFGTSENARFSKGHHGDDSTYGDDVPTFKLNFDVGDERAYFTQDVDYNSYRTRSVVPEADDILHADDDLLEYHRGTLPNVPVNRVHGSYKSIEEYLYTHFELMRTDLLIPLQKAVKTYRKSINKVDQVNLLEDASFTAQNSMDTPAPPPPRAFRVYEHVRLNALVFGPRQVLYRIAFRLPYTENKVAWESSKRLIEGSLVMLSKDNFEKDIKIATVVARGDVPMRGSNRFEYMIDIMLERDSNDMPMGFGDPLGVDQDKYTMIEATEGYFEAYRHILSVMQNMPPEDLPFSSILVDVSKDVLLPHYAAVKRNYDIAPYRNGQRQGPPMPVDITAQWRPYNIGMDSTQVDALKTMLSNNIAIVQGPPGTGKTFVGTYAMRVLLNNFPKSIGPIVCICQTNHALDQFLEHILRDNDEIVRVGSRSKSELMKEHLLYELRKEAAPPKGIGRLYRKRDEIERSIRDIIVELYEEPCVTLDYVKSINGLSARQLDSLKRLGEREKKRSDKKPRGATSFDDDDDDDDDDWVISSSASTTPAPSSRSGSNQQNKRGGRNNRRQQQQSKNAGASSEWLDGNPNLEPEAKGTKVNAIEIWLQDAIEYASANGALYTFQDELKEDLLEQQKGLIFDEEDEEDVMDEDEIREIKLNFVDEPDLRGNKNKFINIGYAYQKQEDPNERPETFWDRVMDNAGNNVGRRDAQARRIVNYKKMDSAKSKATGGFNFFDDLMEESPDEEPQHYVLERWAKDEPDATMWPLPVRLEAHKRWAEQRNRDLSATLRGLMVQYENVSKEIRKLNVTRDVKICRDHRVIGMTSTAAAKYHDLLEGIKPRVMVVEEAAEMLESHIVTALTQSLQHLILIGDHQQLRPQSAVHQLAEKHHLSVSLFERLVMNDLPFTRLSHQRRMRPDIRMMIDPIYSDPPLRDHPDVMRYPAVRGVQEPVYFVSHNEDEAHIPESASKCNEHEALMAAKLSMYLMLQGYSPEDITIITMYAGQRSMIKRMLRAERRADIDPSEILVSSVDGYQGEENKIIILSLVRSNANGQIGFLRVANRVCVSLSRAKHGMYILGNASLLCERSDLWNEIISNLEDHARNRIGSRLPLRCQRHGELTEIQWPVDFATIPEGGCTRPCGERLPCGHVCELPCHPYDHEQVRCRQPCPKILDSCGHQCTRRCYESCGMCLATVQHRFPCGHEVEGECGRVRRMLQNPAGWNCPSCSKG
ncbi:P-loop containing nucleoside triphosphate hydrolase protein [Lichtheimia hyalospora FSU 10163]|nr:P-loop containing nucleoside triphosphate hydrolase protein [Lichtheimia hyalospora FSU 10163]